MTMATMTASWTDSKRYWWLLSPALPLLVLFGLVNFHINGDVFGVWSTPIIVYLVVPFLDLLIGSDRSNPPDSAITDLERDRYYRWIVYAYIPIQYGVTIYGAWLAMRPTTSWLAYVGLIFSVGMINGIGINTAHELGHKRENLERWLSRITLAPVAYGHFFVEHNRGHHRNVATPEDPASS
ncbi:MAG TPA: fatty acid desaturase, partial [Rhizomicrobium sp.]